MREREDREGRKEEVREEGRKKLSERGEEGKRKGERGREKVGEKGGKVDAQYDHSTMLHTHDTSRLMVRALPCGMVSTPAVPPMSSVLAFTKVTPQVTFASPYAPSREILSRTGEGRRGSSTAICKDSRLKPV